MNRDVCEHFTPADLPCDKCSSVQKSAQSEALRLADLLEMGSIWLDQEKAAAELRRLHAQRDALLDALKEIVDAADGTGWDQLDASFSKARAAIAKAEEKA